MSTTLASLAYRLHGTAIIVAAVAAVGCTSPDRHWTDDLAWSPDGRRAAVLADGLRLSDPTGRLSPPLATNVYRVAWLADGQRLALARSREVSTFAEISAAVGPERTRAIVAGAEHLWQHVQADWAEYLESSSSAFHPDLGARVIYLREHYRDALRDRFPDERLEIAGATVVLHALVVARASDDRLDDVRTLVEDVTPIKTIRPGPGDRLLAFVTKDEAFLTDSTARTFVVPVDGSSRPTLVASGSGDLPDWSRDGRSLFYFLASGARYREIETLGYLASRTVLDEHDNLQLAKEVSRLVDVIFEAGDRIRTTRDGRVLFDVVEHRLPRAISQGVMLPEKDQPARTRLDPPMRRQLFAFDPANPNVLLQPMNGSGQLGEDPFGFFDVSPDGAHIVYSTARGRVYRLTVGQDRAELLPLGLDSDAGYTVGELPRIAWSGPDAFTYRKKLGARDEFVLRRGSAEVVLSRDWP